MIRPAHVLPSNMIRPARVSRFPSIMILHLACALSWCMCVCVCVLSLCFHAACDNCAGNLRNKSTLSYKGVASHNISEMCTRQVWLLGRLGVVRQQLRKVRM